MTCRKSLAIGVIAMLAAWPIFKLAREIGADGVEMDMGPLGQRVLFENKLRDEHFQQLFRHTADSIGVKVPSLAMSGFFAQNFLKRDNYRDLINDCLQSMDVMGSKIVFLPLGGSGHEWKENGIARTELVRRLHEVGEMARLAGKIDAVDNGRDPAKELKKLGAKRVAQIHASLTDSVTLDEDPRIDMYRVKKTLDDMNWSGWLVVERSRNTKDVRNVKGNYSRNVAYLKKIFQENK